MNLHRIHPRVATALLVAALVAALGFWSLLSEGRATELYPTVYVAGQTFGKVSDLKVYGKAVAKFRVGMDTVEIYEGGFAVRR